MTRVGITTCIAVAGAAFSALHPLAILQAQQQPIIVGCISTGDSQTCPANTRDGVLLVREQSAGVCQQGSTWTYDRYGITVSGGCSADFLISGRGSRGYKTGGPYGDHGYTDAPATTSEAPRTPPQTTAAPRRLPPALPEGTQIAMQLDNAIRINGVKEGESLTGILVKDLVVAGQIAAAVGSPVQARVVSVAGGQPDIRLVALRSGSYTFPLQSTPVHGMRDVVEVDSTARNGFSTPRKPSIDPTLIFPGSIFVFRLTAPAQPVETQ